MKTLSMTLLGSCLVLSLAACGGAEAELEEPATDDREVNAMVVTCYAYLLDGANFSGPQLAPFPIAVPQGTCVNLPAVSDNRTTSFRLASCGAVFYDYPGCQGASYAAATSGQMPLWFDNRATSVYFP